MYTMRFVFPTCCGGPYTSHIMMQSVYWRVSPPWWFKGSRYISIASLHLIAKFHQSSHLNLRLPKASPLRHQIANIFFVHIVMCKSQRRTAKIAANKFPTCTGQLLSLPWCLRGWGVMGMQSGRGRRSCHLLNCLVISLQRSNNVASLLRDSDFFQEFEQEESPQLLFLLKIIWHIHCSSNNDWYLG